jgi:hypothetical protein
LMLASILGDIPPEAVPRLSILFASSTLSLEITFSEVS